MAITSQKKELESMQLRKHCISKAERHRARRSGFFGFVWFENIVFGRFAKFRWQPPRSNLYLENTPSALFPLCADHAARKKAVFAVFSRQICVASAHRATRVMGGSYTRKISNKTTHICRESVLAATYTVTLTFDLERMYWLSRAETLC